MKVAGRPEALLTVSDAYGTLAAARSWGRAGIGVVLADDRHFGPARWSRYVSRTLACPTIGGAPERFLEWLLDLGAREPGRVLCATSDDLVWLLSRHREMLARSFRLYIPPIEAISTLVDKWQLRGACLELGIDTPDTWLPKTERELRELAGGLPFPVVIKPRTQALLAPHQKGRIVNTAAELLPLYRDLCTHTRHARMLREYDPSITFPIVQAFSRVGADRIYSLAGFIDESGALLVVEASRKVFQWPPHLGIGLCFEEARLVPELARDVARLCRHVGYYGAFEVEFVEAGARRMLIDFNPRFYGQMGFEVARGLDLPLMMYWAATGEKQALQEKVAATLAAAPAPGPHAYCNRIELEVVLRLGAMAGTLEDQDRLDWNDWVARHPGLGDAVVDRDDWLPSVVTGAAALGRALRPRNSWLTAGTSRLRRTPLPVLSASRR